MKRITPALKIKLRKPLGALYSPRQSAALCKALVDQTVYAVGDATVQKLAKLRIPVQVAVYDLKTRRKPINRKEEAWFEKLPGVKIVCVNPAGYITPSLQNAVSLALKSEVPTKVFVVGEEDLAVLPFLRQAGHGVICYGQPGKGMVVVPVNRVTRHLAEKLYAEFRDVK
ncbi:GTP-dependent dephospho-CoA kinase family protein [Candidatus Micrarchaeota archaeon]|nr:GTP-dependent dephospho-CoA kinase family protein [Candidatus Micrarchaeota archaeon]